ncbi:MAG: M24 family metallopeptidase, partial [Gemmataceae bacterium]|nr:M24 family metallopeptidase [Gemmataceae bacterium]
HVTVADFEKYRDLTKTVNWKPGPDRVERLRQIKDAGEIEQIRAAIRMAEKAFAMFRAMLKPEDTEKDLADALESYVRRAGGQSSAFPPIVAVGARAALPHAPPTLKRISEAPLVLVDWGAHGPFYKSDLTRVLLTHNNVASVVRSQGVDPKIRDIYDVVLRAQAQAITTIRPGILAKDVDAAARNVITQAGYGDYFTHSVGHGIGMQVHETPVMRANTEIPLAPGMVVTIEPGIYLPGFAGVRIEDDVLVTPDGREVLSRVPKTLEEAIVEF